jgi:hypothetical protein
MSKKSFVLHHDSLIVVDELTVEQKGELFQAIIDYNLGKEITLTGLMKVVFLPFKNQFIRDKEKYDETVERNKNNGSKGGRPPKPTENEDNPNNPSGFSETQPNPTEPKKADSDSDSVKDKGNDSVKEKKKKVVLDFSFCNENLVEDFKSFVEFRKSIKKPFTTQDQLERLYKKLRELSGGKMETAKKILDQSIVNGWQGVFELKEVKPKQETTTTLNRYKQ